MAERPILFSAPMILAILAGAKTQTRRNVNPTGRIVAMSWPPLHPERGLRVTVRTGPRSTHTGPIGDHLDACPYGQPGDRLWVREEHFRFGHWEPVAGAKTRKGGRQKWMFVADSDETRFTATDGVEVRRGRHHRDPATPAWHKRLARFMPRCLSRITLEVTSVHVERLHDITKEDAIAEGAHAVDGPLGAYGDGPRWSMDRPHPVEVLGRDEGWKRCLGTPQMAFANLWNRINGLDAWYSNPWVWVVSFRKLEVARG